MFKICTKIGGKLTSARITLCLPSIQQTAGNYVNMNLGHNAGCKKLNRAPGPYMLLRN